MNSSDQKCDDFITARVYPILKRSIKRIRQLVQF